MKVVSIPIDVISKTTKEGVVTPVKFRMVDRDGSYIEIKVEQVISRDLERFAGNKMLVFNCQSNVNDVTFTDF